MVEKSAIPAVFGQYCAWMVFAHRFSTPALSGVAMSIQTMREKAGPGRTILDMVKVHKHRFPV